jgi:hypothetical protein
MTLSTNDGNDDTRGRGREQQGRDELSEHAAGWYHAIARLSLTRRRWRNLYVLPGCRLGCALARKEIVACLASAQ